MLSDERAAAAVAAGPLTGSSTSLDALDDTDGAPARPPGAAAPPASSPSTRCSRAGCGPATSPLLGGQARPGQDDRRPAVGPPPRRQRARRWSSPATSTTGPTCCVRLACCSELGEAAARAGCDDELRLETLRERLGRIGDGHDRRRPSCCGRTRCSSRSRRGCAAYGARLLLVPTRAAPDRPGRARASWSHGRTAGGAVRRLPAEGAACRTRCRASPSGSRIVAERLKEIALRHGAAVVAVTAADRGRPGQPAAPPPPRRGRRCAGVRGRRRHRAQRQAERGLPPAPRLRHHQGLRVPGPGGVHASRRTATGWPTSTSSSARTSPTTASIPGATGSPSACAATRNPSRETRRAAGQCCATKATTASTRSL